MIKSIRNIRPKPKLAKPFEWVMRGAYAIHLWLDGNSQWFLLDSDELDDVIIDFYNCGMAKDMAEDKKIGECK